MRKRDRRESRWLGAVAAAVAIVALPAMAAAKCLPIAQGPEYGPLRPIPVAAPAEGSVRITFMGHSSFLIETAGGASAVTDYYGFALPVTPDVATMNNAHSSHYTNFPNPDIGLVLRGWAQDNQSIASYDEQVEDLRVWNVPTNVRDTGGTRFNGNSIFVFEAAGLCIAHLGHLHHDLTDQHLSDLGVIDVLLAPADGAYTLSHDLLITVIGQIRPKVIIPMHYFGTYSLTRFLTKVEEAGFTIDIRDEAALTISRLNMPFDTLIVLGDG